MSDDNPLIDYTWSWRQRADRAEAEVGFQTRRAEQAQAEWDRFKERAERAEAEVEEYKKTLEAWEQGHVGQLLDDIIEWQEEHAKETALADELAEALRDGDTTEEHSRWWRRQAKPALAKWEEARRD